MVKDFTKHIVEGLLGEAANKEIAVYAGSFRPPTRSDYNLLLKALENNQGLDEIHVFVGDAESEGLNQDDAVEIWQMFGKHFPRDFYVHKSEQSPVSDVYAYANKFPTYDINWLFGVREGNSDDFKQIADRTKSVNKYDNLSISPVVYDNKATEREVAAAANMGKDELAKYMPSNLTYKELDDVYNMLEPKQLEEIDDDNLPKFEEVIDKIAETGAQYYGDVSPRLPEDQLLELLKDKEKVAGYPQFAFQYYSKWGVNLFFSDGEKVSLHNITNQDIQDIKDAADLNLNEVDSEDLPKFEEVINKIAETGVKFYGMLSPRMHGSKVIDFLKGEEARVNQPQFAIQKYPNTGFVVIFSDGTRFILGKPTDQDLQDIKDAGEISNLNEAKNINRFEEMINKIAEGDYYYLSTKGVPGIEVVRVRQNRANRKFDLDKPIFSFTYGISGLGGIEDIVARFSDDPENEFWITDITKQDIEDLESTIEMFAPTVPNNLNEMLHTVSGKELKKGISVEMEHTDDKETAKKIALDHLAEDPKYYTKLATLGLEENNDPKGDMNRYQQIIDFMSQNGMKLDPRPTVNIIDNDRENAEQFFGKTAYYDPSNNIVVLYTLGRHPKDVARSFAHELVHCHQNHEGRLEGITTTDTNEDDHLEEIEREAYETGNIMFRKWSDSVKGGALQETVKDNKIICDNCGWEWNIEDGGDDMFTCHKCGSEDNQPIVKEKKQIGKDEFSHELSMLREKRYKDLTEDLLSDIIKKNK